MMTYMNNCYSIVESQF